LVRETLRLRDDIPLNGEYLRGRVTGQAERIAPDLDNGALTQQTADLGIDALDG
jgi:hypothetical protein